MDLSVLRVHQHRAAVAADVIHGVRAGDQDRRAAPAGSAACRRRREIVEARAEARYLSFGPLHGL